MMMISNRKRSMTLTRLLQMSMLSTAVPLSASSIDIVGFGFFASPTFARSCASTRICISYRSHHHRSSIQYRFHQTHVSKHRSQISHSSDFARRCYSKSSSALNGERGDHTGTSFTVGDASDFVNTSSRIISFVSDIEGDAGFFDRFVENSRILKFESIEPQLSESKNHDGDFFPYNKQVVFCDDENYDKECNHRSILVCGGDMWDKGGNDLYVMRQLLSLHRRYGDKRVHFILGNRDINKIRILQELGLGNSDGNGDGDKLPLHGGIYWFKGTGLQGDPDLIERHHHKEQEQNRTGSFSPGKSDNFEEDKDDNGNEDDIDITYSLIPNTSTERLKWLLRKTMGSPDAFEFRRGELEQEKKIHSLASASISDGNNGDSAGKATAMPVARPIAVTDAEVVQSYRKSCHPHGVMGEYISRGKLCLKLGGAMFMHGSLPITPDLLSMFREEEENCDNSRERHDQTEADKTPFWTKFYQYALPFAGKDKSGIEMPIVNSIQDWINALNDFATKQYHVWKHNITHVEEQKVEEDIQLGMWSTVGHYQNTSSGAREIGSLCQYGMGWLPGRKQNPTVVYQSWLKDGYPKFHEESSDTYRELVKDFFHNTGIDVIVTGHQPVGDLPFPIQVSNEGDKNRRFIVVSDTSYSGDTKWMNSNGRKNLGRGKAVSGRGDVAVSEVILQQCLQTGKICSISSHGVLSDGSRYESENFLSKDEDSLMIGNLVDRNKLVFEGSIQEDSNDEVDWFVRSKFKDGTFLVSTGKGYEVFNSIAKKR